MSSKKMRKTLMRAKEGDENAILDIINTFKPLLYKNSFINGVYDEDCFQELNIKLLNCIKAFDFSHIEKMYANLKNKSTL